MLFICPDTIFKSRGAGLADRSHPDHTRRLQAASYTLLVVPMDQHGSKSGDRSQGREGTWMSSAALVAFLCIFLGATSTAWSHALRPDQTNYALRAERILESTPLIDGHNDLPYLLRIELQNKINGNNTFTFRDGKCSKPNLSCDNDHADTAR